MWLRLSMRLKLYSTKKNFYWHTPWKHTIGVRFRWFCARLKLRLSNHVFISFLCYCNVCCAISYVIIGKLFVGSDCLCHTSCVMREKNVKLVLLLLIFDLLWFQSYPLKCYYYEKQYSFIESFIWGGGRSNYFANSMDSGPREKWSRSMKTRAHNTKKNSMEQSLFTFFCIYFFSILSFMQFFSSLWIDSFFCVNKMYMYI